MPDKTSLLRNLVPKSYHFDGYNELNCPNIRGRPFFSNEVIKIGDYHLTKTIDEDNNLVLSYESVCGANIISFIPYCITMEEFVKLLKGALDESSDFITFEVRMEMRSTIYKECEIRDRGLKDVNCHYGNNDCMFLLDNMMVNHNWTFGAPARYGFMTAAVSFNVTDIKNALSVYYDITKPTNSLEGGTTMKGNMKKLFGMNLEMGMCKDPNIASTVMGVAVRNSSDGNWYIYDSVKHTRTNMAGIKMGNFPIMLVPVQAQALCEGMMVKMDGKYSFIHAIDQKQVTLLDGADGNIRTKLLEDSIIPGMQFYTRVVAFDPKTLMDANSKDNMSGNMLAAICMMQWSKGESDFSLDNISNDSYNGFGEYLPMLIAFGGNNGLGGMFKSADGSLNLPLLMMMGGSEDNDMMQMVVLSQLLGGQNGSNIFGTLSGMAESTTQAVTADATNEVFCPTCNTEYSADTKFCPKCGTHTQPIVKGKVCAKCGTVLRDGAIFCHNCGEKVPTDVYCPHCGTKAEEGANFCSKCGKPLKNTVNAEETPEQASKAVETPADNA